MSLSIGTTPPPSTGFVATTMEPRRPSGPAQGHASEALKAAFDVDLAELVPRVPPMDVQRDVQFAAQRAAQMAADDRELHFTVDGETGRVVVQVRDLDGEVLRTIPGTHALDVLAGLEEL
jgi:hypothetical protein